MTAFEFVLICTWLSVLVSDKIDDIHRSKWPGYLKIYKQQKLEKKAKIKKEKV
jgi:hypothetical protein